MNKIIIKGRLTKIPEAGTTQSGKSYSRFSVAVNRRFKKDEADFFSCTAWDKTAELVNKYFDKGSEIIVCGEMQSTKKDDKVYWGIQADQVDFCGSKSKTDDKPFAGDYKELGDDDDLPF